MKTLALLVVLLFVAPPLAGAQGRGTRKPPPPKPTQGNPVAFAWVCPQHAMHSQHELDIIETSSGEVIQTVLLGDPVVQASGDVLAEFRVAPTTPGTYVARVRAVGPEGPSEASLPSDAWVTSAGPWDQAPQ